jgi:hypothetical protein
MRYGGRIQVFDCADMDLDIGDWVVIKDFDVLRMGLVTTKPIIWPANQQSRQVFLPSERLLIRLATPEDLSKQAENQLIEREGLEYCQTCINNQNLIMKLVAVEVTFDNFKTIFYYTAEDRVDFRQLVKELVSRFRTRIEMRQIGVRNEALMLGGMGVCGRPFCCSGFLTNFTPVSVRMAKEQNLNLNTVKISGVCGRLMCCLAFENFTVDVTRHDDDAPETLEALRKAPKWPHEPRPPVWPDPSQAITGIDAKAAAEAAAKIKQDAEPKPPPDLLAEIKAGVDAEATEAQALAKEISAEVNRETQARLLDEVRLAVEAQIGQDQPASPDPVDTSPPDEAPTGLDAEAAAGIEPDPEPTASPDLAAEIQAVANAEATGAESLAEEISAEVSAEAAAGTEPDPEPTAPQDLVAEIQAGADAEATGAARIGQEQPGSPEPAGALPPAEAITGVDAEAAAGIEPDPEPTAPQDLVAEIQAGADAEATEPQETQIGHDQPGSPEPAGASLAAEAQALPWEISAEVNSETQERLPAEVPQAVDDQIGQDQPGPPEPLVPSPTSQATLAPAPPDPGPAESPGQLDVPNPDGES